MNSLRSSINFPCLLFMMNSLSARTLVPFGYLKMPSLRSETLFYLVPPGLSQIIGTRAKPSCSCARTWLTLRGLVCSLRALRAAQEGGVLVIWTLIAIHGPFLLSWKSLVGFRKVWHSEQAPCLNRLSGVWLKLRSEAGMFHPRSESEMISSQMSFVERLNIPPGLPLLFLVLSMGFLFEAVGGVFLWLV